MSVADDQQTERARKFGETTSAAARAAGYDIDRPRGGGKKDLAAASGMSPASVSRMLAGKAIPDPKFFPGLARALRISLRQLLIDSELATADTLPPELRDDDVLEPIQAVRRVGIRQPSNVRLATQFLQSLLDEEKRTQVEATPAGRTHHAKHSA